jgi:hypothetical protein
MTRVQDLQQSLPNQTDYDLDGDGQMSEIEQAAFDQEMQSWRASQAGLPGRDAGDGA